MQVSYRSDEACARLGKTAKETEFIVEYKIITLNLYIFLNLFLMTPY